VVGPETPQQVCRPGSGREVSRERRLALIRQYGGFTLAYSTAVQPQLSYFETEDGYLAYAQRGKLVFVLGDPVAPMDRHSRLLAEFLGWCPKPTFVQISDSTAGILHQRRFFINEMGIDTSLDLRTFNFRGKAREWLRYASNWIQRRGYRIEDGSFTRLASSDVRDLSEEWRRTRTVKRREVSFLNRPIVYGDEPDVRKFFLFLPDGTLAAFVFFDPLYRSGQVVGYCTSIKRRRPGISPYAEPAIMKSAIEQFQREGMEQLHLGLSPLAGIKNREFRANPLLHFSFRYGFRAWWVNRYFYNLIGHAHYKQRFGGESFPTYYASPILFNDVRIATLLKMCGIL
jgi:phosphatidylglycerol lysyltransferase